MSIATPDAPFDFAQGRVSAPLRCGRDDTFFESRHSRTLNRFRRVLKKVQLRSEYQKTEVKTPPQSYSFYVGLKSRTDTEDIFDFAQGIETNPLRSRLDDA